MKDSPFSFHSPYNFCSPTFLVLLIKLMSRKAFIVNGLVTVIKEHVSFQSTYFSFAARLHLTCTHVFEKIVLQLISDKMSIISFILLMKNSLWNLAQNFGDFNIILKITNFQHLWLWTCLFKAIQACYVQWIQLYWEKKFLSDSLQLQFPLAQRIQSGTVTHNLVLAIQYSIYYLITLLTVKNP